MENLVLGVVVAKIEHQPINGSSDIVMPEPQFYDELAEIAKQRGILLYVFSPSEWVNGSLYGFRKHNKRWVKEIVPLPDIVYDRCFFSTAKQKQDFDEMMSLIKRKKRVQLLNGSLPNKLHVYEALRNVESLIPYLPHTEELKTLSSITRWLQLYEDGVVLKPATGMHGKGVLHIANDNGSNCLNITGRTLRNELIEMSFCHALNAYKWLFRYKKGLQYLIQPYLNLRTADQRPFDIRVLMQKDETGKWQHSGSVARVGRTDGLTSNIHGGGIALDAQVLLEQILGGYKAERLLQKLHMISGQTVSALEGSFGRFGELALDFGVTPQGSIWLLECNSKPGRQAFIDDSKFESRILHERPLQYAQYLQLKVSRNQQVM